MAEQVANHQIDKMETTKKRQLLQIIDTFIEADQSKSELITTQKPCIAGLLSISIDGCP